MTYKEWIESITAGLSQREIAEKLGTSHPTVGRNMRSADPAFTVEIAAHFGANPIDGLVAGKFISKEQIAEYAAANGIGVEHYSDLATVTEFPIYDVRSDQYAADNSETEPEPGDDDYNDGP